MRVFRRQRSRPITEALAYARCHGDRGRDIVRVVKLQPHQRVTAGGVSGETLRRAFEGKLAERAS